MKTYSLFKSIINLSWLGLFILIVFTSLAVSNEFSSNDEEEIGGVCGTVSEYESAPYSELADKGKTLFKVNCASCHAKDMKSRLTGPALGGVEERWIDYPREDLYNWIRNSSQLVEIGHPKAVALVKEWETTMTAFPTLKDDDIEAILAYVKYARK